MINLYKLTNYICSSLHENFFIVRFSKKIERKRMFELLVSLVTSDQRALGYTYLEAFSLPAKEAHGYEGGGHLLALRGLHATEVLV